MTTNSEKLSGTFTKAKNIVITEGVGVVGLGSLFAGCWLQFGLGIALIVNGVLFVATAIASAFRG